MSTFEWIAVGWGVLAVVDVVVLVWASRHAPILPYDHPEFDK